MFRVIIKKLATGNLSLQESGYERIGCSHSFALKSVTIKYTTKIMKVTIQSK